MRKAITLGFTLFLALGLFGVSQAVTPQLINYQGFLTNSLGDPVADGSHSVVFIMREQEILGVLLWTEPQNVTTSGGFFTALLGSVVPFPDTLFDDSASLWLGIAVDGDPEMTPRRRMTSAPYSIISKRIRGDIETNPGQFLIRDSLGDTVLQFINKADLVEVKVKSKSLGRGAGVTVASTFESILKAIAKDSADSSKQKTVETGANQQTAYIVMLDSLNDTTIVIKGSRDADGSGGSIVVSSGEPANGVSNQVEIVDLDSDGLTDIKINGNVIIGDVPASEKLTVIGNICATGTIGPCSDVRFKKNISTLKNPLRTIMKIRGVEFDYRTDEFPEKKFRESQQVGFIAQELKDILPCVVSKGADGYYSVDYGRLTPILVESIKEQQKQIESQQGQIDELKRIVDKLVSATQTNVTVSKK